MAPSSPLREGLFQEGVREIESFGFRVVFDEGIGARERYLAGTDERRAAEIHRWYADPAVRAVFCARGGYGAPRLMPLLDAALLLRDPKPLVGFSDATVLLHFLLDRCGFPGVHGPMVAWDIRQGRERYDRDLLLKLLTSPEPAGRIVWPALSVLRPGRASGPLSGGCLSLLASLAGTPWAPVTKGSILLLEDWRAKPYQLDRSLQQLRHAGLLTGIRGIVFGEMNECRQTEDQGYTIEEVLLDCLRGIDVPILFGFPAGHTAGIHRPLPLGIRVTIEADPAAPAVVLDEALVTE